MRLRQCFLCLFIPLCLSTHAQAQLWSGIIDPSRAIDWSLAGAGAIPTRNTICATLSPGATLAQINTAIANCPSGQVVYLNAGTYSGLNGQIFFNNKSNVTLRGAGPDKTFLVWTAQGGCNGLGADVCVYNNDGNWGGAPMHTANWTAGYAKGTTSITLSNVTGLQVGSLLILDQLDDPSDTGNIFVCQTSGSDGSCSQEGGISNGRSGRGQNQEVTVTSISGTGPSTVGVTPGLYAPNWRSGQSPGAWWGSPPITGVGIEDLSMDHRWGSTIGIEFANAKNCWAKNVRSLGVGNNHIMFYQSAHNTVRDSYFYGGSGSSEGYGVQPGFSSADNLIQNNIFQHLATPTITEGATGNVFGYNYAVDDYFGPGNWQMSDAWHHSVGDYYNLWEGQEGIGVVGDAIHGTAFMNTHFRNYFNGRDPAGGGTKTQATFAYFLMSFNRYYNSIGNVLGTASYHTHYSTQASAANACDNDSVSALSVFVLGYSDQAGTQFSRACGFSFNITNDMMVASTLMRWGNYAACTGDSACNGVRFVGSEVPSGINPYGNAVPATQTLPASFYLSAKPGWWGTLPWPAIGPDITGGNVANVGGHVYLTPSANCYLNIMGGKTDGSSGILTFNANSCYVANPAPPPPTNLTATPH